MTQIAPTIVRDIREEAGQSPSPGAVAASQRSLSVEVLLQATWYGDRPRLTALSAHGLHIGYRRRWLGLDSGVHDGVIVGNGILCPRGYAGELLARSRFDVATVRLGSSGLGTHECNVVERMAGYDLISRPTHVQEVMHLQRDVIYTGNTRHNITRLRRRAAKTGVSCFWQPERPRINGGEITRLSKMNMPTPIDPYRLLGRLRFSERQPFPFLVTMRSGDKRLIALGGGFIENQLALMTFQANDAEFSHLGSSLLLRAFLIERLRERGVAYLCFVGGCSGMLLHTCERVPIVDMLLTRRSFLGRAKLLACTVAQPESRIGRLNALQHA